MVILFFGGSIFVHELGHFLAAKWRGLHIERFSIGFGPKICSWKRGGVEYRLSWLPLGGYVALPQLADMRGIEGESSIDVQALPHISYTSKVIVAVAGAVFNVIFAFLLATLLYFTGRPSSEMLTSTEIGYVSNTLIDAEGVTHEGPAKKAGIQIGDIVVSIDGNSVEDWIDIHKNIALSSGKDADGNRLIDFEILRDGQTLHLPVQPIISEDYKIRQVGLQAGYTLIIARLYPDSPLAKAGVLPGDKIIELDGSPIRNYWYFLSLLEGKVGHELPLLIDRNGERIETKVTPRSIVVWSDGKEETLAGIAQYQSIPKLLRQTPTEQLSTMISDTLRNISSLVNRHSDIGLSHMSGPAGIIRVIYNAAQYSLLQTIWITMFINISLAFFNLLPIPVLDGGHIAFATFSKLRGKPINPNIVASMQGSFMLLLLTLVIYISFFDISRWVSDTAAQIDYKERSIPPDFSKPSPSELLETSVETAE